MNMKEKREEILTSLELAVSEILSPKQMNVWISVKERSITKILTEAGVNVNYSSAVMEELKKIGLVEREGMGLGMMYKIISNVIPDSGALAERIYENFKERYKRGKTDDMPASRPSDLRPFRPKSRRNTMEHGTVTFIPNEIAKLGDMGYFITDNSIVEVRLVSVHYADDDFQKILYDVERSIETKDENGQTKTEYVVVRNVCRGKFFKTPDDAAAFLVRRCLKYTKRAVIKRGKTKL